MRCFNDDDAIAFVDGELADRRDAEHHVDNCDRCRRLVAGLLKMDTRSAQPRRAVTLTSGATVGRYEIREQLGSGGMGVVYRAHDPELDRDIALKLISERVLATGSDSELGDRLRTEARSLARVDHPNVVGIYDAGRSGAEIYIAMELVAGLTFDRWLAAAPRAAREIIATFIAAGRGLAAVHAAGLVHRDFKPRNLLVGDDGRVRVADLGLASARTSSLPEGTPRYMSPEQRNGGDVDARSDQFSYCVALAEALAGVPRVPRRARTVIQRGLSADRERRFASIDLLVGDLERSLGAASRAWPRVALVAALVAAIAGIAVRSAGDPTTPRERASSPLAAVLQLHGRDSLRNGERQQATIEAQQAIALAAGDRGVEAEASWDLAELTRDVPARKAMLFASARAAHAGGRDELAARAWTGLALISGLGERSHIDGDRWAGQAAASLERSGAPPEHAQLAGLEAMSALAQGRHRDARVGAEQTLARTIATLGPSHAETRRARNTLGMVHVMLGDTRAAEREFRLVVAAAEHAGDPELTSYLANLGQVLVGPEAIQLLTRVVALEEAAHGEIVPALLNLASAFRDHGDHAAAAHTAERALARSEASSDRIDALNILGSIDLERRQWTAAASRFRAALQLLQREATPDPVSIANSYTRLAAVDEARGRFADALASYQRALSAAESASPPDTGTIAVASAGLGRAALDIGELDRATSALERAVSLYDHELAEQHSTGAAAARFDLARAVADLDPDRALALARRALADHHRLGEHGDSQAIVAITAWLARR